MNSTRRILAFVAVLGLLVAGSAVAATVGDKAPGFTLTDLEGNQHSLADFEGKVVVLEWTNPGCPFVQRHAEEQTMVDLAESHSEVVWLAINSTNPDHSNYLEPSEHAEWAAEHGIDYAILYDESGDVGRAYDAKTTPHMFIIDTDGTLVYDGAIDDDPRGSTAQAERTNYVGGGLVAVASNSSVDPATTKPYGCSVKY